MERGPDGGGDGKRALSRAFGGTRRDHDRMPCNHSEAARCTHRQHVSMAKASLPGRRNRMLGVYLSAKEHRDLKRRAAAEHRTVSTYVRATLFLPSTVEQLNP